MTPDDRPTVNNPPPLELLPVLLFNVDNKPGSTLLLALGSLDLVGFPTKVVTEITLGALPMVFILVGMLIDGVDDLLRGV